MEDTVHTTNIIPQSKDDNNTKELAAKKVLESFTDSNNTHTKDKQKIEVKKGKIVER